MAHLPEGVVSGALVAYGFIFSGSISMVVGRKLRVQNIPKISMVTAAVFSASLFHLPLFGTSVHFTFVGLAGMLLGPVAFLSTMVAVFLQGLLFQHGGLSTLGINTLNIGLAALTGSYIFRLRHLLPRWHAAVTVFAFLAGFGAAVIMVALLSMTLLLSGFPAASIAVVFLAHLPIMLGEGLVCGLLAAGLQKSRGEMFFHE